MKFNPDITKQAVEVIFSTKYKKENHPYLTFNNIPVARHDATKHIGMILDEKLTFRKHIKEAIEKAKISLGLMKYMSKYVNRKVLDQMYKMYVRPHLDYGDIIFHDQHQDTMKLLDSIQYQAGLIVTGCWKSTSAEKLYTELGWETLSERRICRRFCQYYKILNNKTPLYLRNHIKELPLPQNCTERYKNSFFPYCALHWGELDEATRQLGNIDKFKSEIFKSVRPPKKQTYSIKDKYGLSLLTRLRVEFSDLREYRFRRNFNCTSPLCKCAIENEDNEHFLLRCNLHRRPRLALFNSITQITNDVDILFSPPSELSNLLLYGSSKFDEEKNTAILRSTIKFIHDSSRFKKLEAYPDPA